MSNTPATIPQAIEAVINARLSNLEAACLMSSLLGVIQHLANECPSETAKQAAASVILDSMKATRNACAPLK
jgi:hypothetical protein